MKGVVFNMLEEFVVENAGEEVFEEILDTCEFINVEPFVGPGTYPDEDLNELVSKTIAKLDIPLPDALRAFGKFAFPKLTEKVPDWLVNHAHPKDFLLTLENIVHVEVRKLYKDADPPRFSFADPGPDELVINYQSGRRLYDFMDGLIEGVGDHFDTAIEYTREITAENGEEYCQYHLKFAAGA